jgi:hypothetical protein
MVKILNHRPAGRITAAIGHRHGDQPSREICDFCGEAVVNKLLEKLLGQPSGRVYFVKDSTPYHLYGGPSRAVTIPGKFCFNVYKYSFPG